MIAVSDGRIAVRKLQSELRVTYKTARRLKSVIQSADDPTLLLHSSGAGDRATAAINPADADNDSREQILQAARHVIVQRGFAQTRVADIARVAGVSTGTVHYHFDTKEGVLLAALKSHIRAPWQRLDQLIGSSDSATSRLARLIDHSVMYPGEQRDEYVLWLELWVHLLHNQGLRPEIENIAVRWREYFLAAIESGIAAGEFTPEIPPADAADQLVACCDGQSLYVVLGYEFTNAQRMHRLMLQLAAHSLNVSMESLEAAAPVRG
jgi:AcrR family transcriptional regulator